MLCPILNLGPVHSQSHFKSQLKMRPPYSSKFPVQAILSQPNTLELCNSMMVGIRYAYLLKGRAVSI